LKLSWSCLSPSQLQNNLCLSPFITPLLSERTRPLRSPRWGCACKYLLVPISIKATGRLGIRHLLLILSPHPFGPWLFTSPVPVNLCNHVPEGRFTLSLVAGIKGHKHFSFTVMVLIEFPKFDQIGTHDGLLSVLIPLKHFPEILSRFIFTNNDLSA
jgi:hypothetical protein